MNKMKAVIFLILTSLALAATKLGAAQIVQNFSVAPTLDLIGPTTTSQSIDSFEYFVFTVDQFDPSLGTLESVQIIFDIDFSAFGMTGDSSGFINLNLGGTYLIDGSGFDGTGDGGGTGDGPNTALSLYVDYSEDRLYGFENPTHDLSVAKITGTGTFEFSFVDDVSFSIGGIDSHGATLDYHGGTVSWVYAYIAVPEPSTYALMLGLVVLGVVVLRRKLRR